MGDASSADDDSSTGGGIPDAYLLKLDAAHTDFFARCPPEAKQAVDATMAPQDVAAAVIAAIESIDCTAHKSSPLHRGVSPQSVMATVAPMELF